MFSQERMCNAGSFSSAYIVIHHDVTVALPGNMPVKNIINMTTPNLTHKPVLLRIAQMEKQLKLLAQ